MYFPVCPIVSTRKMTIGLDLSPELDYADYYIYLQMIFCRTALICPILIHYAQEKVIKTIGSG